MADETDDRAVRNLIQRHCDRATKGYEKYGTTTNREDLSLRDWVLHALEEQMDSCIYLEKMLEKIDNAPLEVRAYLEAWHGESKEGRTGGSA